MSKVVLASCFALFVVLVLAAAEPELATRAGSKKFYYDSRNKGSVDIEMTLEDAIEYCEENNMKIATIRNKQESDAVTKFMKKFGRPVWLGGSDKLSPGQWYWIHDKSPITFTNWGRSQQELAETRDHYNCIRLTSETGKWDANYCEITSRPLCEKV